MSFQLEIARLRLEISCTSTIWEDFLTGPLWGPDCRPTPFFANASQPDMRLQIGVKPLSDNGNSALVLDLVRGVSWRRQGTQTIMQRLKETGQLYWLVTYNQDFTECQVDTDVSFAPANHADWFPELFWQALLNHVAHNELGACFHSCGVVDNDAGGYLFIGHSGAGKSTTARLWDAQPRVRVLSDERILVRRLNGEHHLYGTPWFSRANLSQPGHAPLKAVFSLRHGPQNEIRLLSHAASVAEMFSCSHPTHHNLLGIDRSLVFLEALAKRVPHYVLSFTPEVSVVDFVRQAISRT